MTIEHICFDVDDTLYPPSKDFKDAKDKQHTKRLVELLAEKNSKDTIELVERLLKEKGFNISFTELTVESYKYLVKTYGEGGNANLYKKLGVDHTWVERDVFYTDRSKLIDWSHSPAIIEALKGLKKKGINLSIFSNTSYGSVALNLKLSGFTPEIQEELFSVGCMLPLAEENIGETSVTLEQKLKAGKLTQLDFEYLSLQYDAKADFLRRKINVLSSEDSSDYKKPGTGGYERIKRCVAMPPERIMYVGDSPEKDIAPAKKAGLKSCYVLWGGKVKLHNADYVIDKLTEIADVIK